MYRFNIFGCAFVVVIMIPNIIFAIRHKDGFENKQNCRTAEIIEQIGRFGCIGFMMFNIPGICFGWRSDEAFAVYLIIGALLCLLYCAVWIFFRKPCLARSLALSVIPSALFFSAAS